MTPHIYLLFCLISRVFSLNSIQTTYLKFFDQHKEGITNAENYATLKSTPTDLLLKKGFSICGGIYIGYFRETTQALYTVKNNGTVWFSLMIHSQDLERQSYKSMLSNFDGAVFSTSNAKLALRPHGWSHACTSVDGESGRLTAVINGVVAHDEVFIPNQSYNNRGKLAFQNNLVLGVEASNKKYSQSEASVTNVNVYSKSMDKVNMVSLTSTRQFFLWEFTGQVEAVIVEDTYTASYYPNLYPMSSSFVSWQDCMTLCPRLQSGGRVPLTNGTIQSEHLAKYLRNMSYDRSTTQKSWKYAPFHYISEGHFEDFYSGAVAPSNWYPGEPNGGKGEQCTAWKGVDADMNGLLLDVSCETP